MKTSRPKTISEKILSAKSGTDAYAGDIVVCDVDLVIGTDASSPMSIAYFEKMGGHHLFDPDRVVFALDHYAPPSTPKTAAFHDQVRAFVRQTGAQLHEVGEGISHQLVAEEGRALPGALVIGADSHTVTCGALNLFATGVGSSDLAAAMITGRVWLRVPETIEVKLTGKRPRGLAAKDVSLALVAELGADGANYQALEIGGPSVRQFTLEERFVFSNLAVESGAKAAIFPADHAVESYLSGRSTKPITRVAADAGATYARTVTIDISGLSPRIAIPHSPNDVVAIEQIVGTPVQMVFLGTCTGGRVPDFHAALDVLERAGGHVAPGVQLVVTPASREVYLRLIEDGTLGKLAAMGAIVTTPGCGACCGTSGAIPGDGMTVLSTANRNFKARMGNPTASIYLASPAACAAAAATGSIIDPRTID
ncbi:MAG TPA: aconitase/3-isopropylmalate dehydratase large subunit family protein [Gemmatimonadaceae bacterium]|nr:aconitase/3-isopropylmalate dehydratase large subunit family protein [Acidimicrobiia bacterium]